MFDAVLRRLNNIVDLLLGEAKDCMADRRHIELAGDRVYLTF